MKMNKKGFTLVELLAVLAIIAIIGMIAIPNVISLMDNSKKDQMINDANRLISLMKNHINADREFRAGTAASKKVWMGTLDPNGSINPDPDGFNYHREIGEGKGGSYVIYYRNGSYCVYLKGEKRVIQTDSKGCVKEENLSRSSVKDVN